MCKCGQELIKAGAKSVSGYVTHPEFTNRAWLNVIAVNIFNKFWVTDSCPETIEAIEGKEPFEVISLASSIAELFSQRINK
jgi:phosphoribosylpyrophosphate synthetase